MVQNCSGELLAAQAKRRDGVAAEHSRLLEGQRQERAALAAEQLSERQALRAGYLAEARRIKAPVILRLRELLPRLAMLRDQRLRLVHGGQRLPAETPSPGRRECPWS